MHRFALLISSFVVFAGLLGYARDDAAMAQEAMASHPVVGVWDSTGELAGNTFPFLAIFHGDGTYMEIYPWGTVIIGAWQPTGERTAEATAVNYEFIDDRLVRGEARFTAEVDETGNAIATDGTFVSRFEDGTIDLAVEGPSPGVRLEVLPVVPLAELVPGGTPVIPAELTGEATPTP
jgi:hypothetical protein